MLSDDLLYIYFLHGFLNLHDMWCWKMIGFHWWMISDKYPYCADVQSLWLQRAWYSKVRFYRISVRRIWSGYINKLDSFLQGSVLPFFYGNLRLVMYWAYQTKSVSMTHSLFVCLSTFLRTVLPGFTCLLWCSFFMLQMLSFASNALTWSTSHSDTSQIILAKWYWTWSKRN